MVAKLSDEEIRKARCALLSWFRRNARSLPWRKTRNPYAIWLSEVMLQQTQVATVVPYYRRFLRAYPSLERLATARREQVLELWSGLGYYRRAVNLHQAAKVLVKEFGGRFPRDYHLVRKLPGIGEYTARAVLSIAHNQPYAVFDGNVARVMARLCALKGNVSQPAFRHAAQAELERLLSRRRPGNFNQALMELGQTICLPRSPHCGICPLRSCCSAYRKGAPESFPTSRRGRVTESHYLASALLFRSGRVAMVRGLDDGLLEQLWNFPSALGRSRAEAQAQLQEKLDRMTGGQAKVGEPVAEVQHGITYRSIRVRIYRAQFQAPFPTNGFRWFQVSRLPQAAISQLARKIALAVSDEEYQL